jgi:ethanolamine utilization protein EutA (predicted chaperonin)
MPLLGCPQAAEAEPVQAQTGLQVVATQVAGLNQQITAAGSAIRLGHQAQLSGSAIRFSHYQLPAKGLPTISFNSF